MNTKFLIRVLLVVGIPWIQAASGQSISGVVNSYYQVTAVNTGTNTVTLNTTTGLSPGTKVLIMQMKGATIDATNTANFGNITAINDAGNYEFNIICSITGNNAQLKFQLIRTYDPTTQVQLVSVPVYKSVTISDTLQSTAWNPATGTGGIVAIEATDTVYLNSSIDVAGQGFQGGPLSNWPVPPYNCDWLHTVSAYYLSNPPSDAWQTGGQKGESISAYINGEDYGMGKQASGGGGGNNTNTGGAGGANYGSGGSGGKRSNESPFQCHGQYPGIGGLSLSPYGYSAAQNRIYFGGGGGAGHENNAVGLPGANGGGIIIITANVLAGTGGNLLADGLAPINPSKPDPTEADGDGGGGGGGGGTIILNVNKVTGSINAEANGGNGSNSSNIVTDCMGPGGGGGAGVIWSSGASFPASVTTSVKGGANGVIAATALTVACRGQSNGATSGANGQVQAAYSAPIGTSPVCTVLASSALVYFQGNLTSTGAHLDWKITDPSSISSFYLERSINQVSYETIGTLQSTGAYTFSFDDPQKMDGTIYYRLMVEYSDGSFNYSQVLPLTRYASDLLQIVSMGPNPATQQLNLALYSKKTMTGAVTIVNAYGQRLYTSATFFNTGYIKLQLPLSHLAAGVYFLVLEGDNTRLVRRFVKLNAL